ncbi:hypothetical protein C0Q70_10324 [Pomacea canaliculata]|uniref:Uncharacterized protein n=1 Tax=Pomacea canaliculata TaxID=400727 RepID=A0A2T7PC99_POMCA|nr:hypothetical protein C0Q70_10324 [Pomacea canaliculata]
MGLQINTRGHVASGCGAWLPQHHVAEVGHLSALWCGAARAASLLLLAPATGPATQAGPAPPGGETLLLQQLLRQDQRENKCEHVKNREYLKTTRVELTITTGHLPVDGAMDACNIKTYFMD